MERRLEKKTDRLLKIDPAEFVDKTTKYTGQQFSDLEVRRRTVANAKIAEIAVGRAETPLDFVQPGNYETSPGKQKTAFARGTIYFRHGAKSEPGNSKALDDSSSRKWLEFEELGWETFERLPMRHKAIK